MALALAACLSVAQLKRAVAGEGSFEYRYENYAEDNDRVLIETHVGAFDVSLRPWLSLKGEVIYDGISGATPDGAPTFAQVDPLHHAGKNKVRLSNLVDVRYAENVATVFLFGRHRLTPQFSYSEEGDYISYGAALNYSIELDEKNTTLSLGYSHNFDTILPKGFLSVKALKDADEGMIGVNQLLGPKTVLTVNYVYGNARGYLDDQYKGVVFVDESSQWFYDDINAYYDHLTELHTFAEKRPRSRDKQVVYAQLTQFITPLNASIEASYRFYHDTFGVDAHTFSLAWFQKIGKHVVVSPMFRYYTQSAASFYGVSFAGDPLLAVGAPLDAGLPNAGPDGGEPNPAPPSFYSSDYRLSKLDTFTYGISVNARIAKWLSIVGSYERYEMQGRDGITAASAYPNANIFTIGAQIYF